MALIFSFFFSQGHDGEVPTPTEGPPEVLLIVKGDVDGTAEAVATAVMQLSSPLVGVRVIQQGVGALTAADVHLAEVTGAALCAFNVGGVPSGLAVDVRTVSPLLIRCCFHLPHAASPVPSH
jgi:translation initiation factor IF-2